MSRMAEAKAALLVILPSLLAELVPGGKHHGGLYEGKNPTREDRHAGSFKVWTRGSAAGAWKDFSTGDKGDVVDLVAYVKRCSRADALAWAEERTGIRRMDATTREKLKRQHARRAKAEADRDEEKLAKARQRAGLLFHNASPIWDTPAEWYLRSRGIDMRALGDRLEPKTFRFTEGMEWWMGREGETPGPQLPCLLSAMTNAEGLLKAVHFTFIAPDGRGKAPVPKPKLMWPRTAGLVIRATRGATSLAEADAIAQGRLSWLAVAEGVEDALSIGMACPDFRAHAVGSLPGLLTMPECRAAEGYLIARDNDWGKPEAGKLFERAMQRISAWGRPAIAVSSSIGKDFNDALRSNGRTSQDDTSKSHIGETEPAG